MTPDELIQERLRGSLAAKGAFVATQGEKLAALALHLEACFRSGSKLLIFGNGGSAADAQHLAAEFVNRFLINRRPLAALALTTDSSTLTAIANDFAYEDIFAKQIEALGRRGDVALGISTSGNSANVLRGLHAARQAGLFCVGLSGGLARDDRPAGGQMAELCDLLLTVPSAETPHIQETHLFIEHLLCELVERALFPPDSGH